jgi:hypothetical protein
MKTIKPRIPAADENSVDSEPTDREIRGYKRRYWAFIGSVGACVAFHIAGFTDFIRMPLAVRRVFPALELGTLAAIAVLVIYMMFTAPLQIRCERAILRKTVDNLKAKVVEIEEESE